MAVVAALAGALAWQVYAIWPYISLHEPEAKVLTGCEPESRLSLLVANVLIENKESAPLLALADRSVRIWCCWSKPTAGGIASWSR